MPNGKVLDWNKNLVIDKEDYYYLTDFKPICILPQSKLEEDYKEDLINRVGSLKVYLTSRDEIIDDLKRRKAECINQIGSGNKRPEAPDDDGMRER